MPSTLPDSGPPQPSAPRGIDFHGIDLRIIGGVVLLLVAGFFTWQTIDGLSERRKLRYDLAEISHARYGLLNADVWVAKIVPILNSRIDALDLTASDQASLKPAVEKMLYALIDQIKVKMSAKSSQGLGALIGANSMMTDMIVGMIKPNVPQYADAVLAELGKPENKEALKNYIKNVLVQGAKSTFGSADMQWYSHLLQIHGCTDAASCRQILDARIHELDSNVNVDYLFVLAASAIAFLLLMIGRPVLRRTDVVVLMLFCLVLLIGGILTPMLEVEARISRMSMTFLGQPVSFSDQLLYFQSKSVLEVFHTLVTTAGRPDMWFVGVLVLMFSVIFPTLKTCTLGVCLFKPSLLRTNRVVKFLGLESSKWSMADVMALAIFMSFVAFNGLIPNSLSGLRQTGAELVIPTDSSKILPGYLLFIGFCLASLFLSKRLERGIESSSSLPPSKLG